MKFLKKFSLLILLILLSCSDDNEPNTIVLRIPSVKNATYELLSVDIEEPIDVYNNRIYSTNLFIPQVNNFLNCPTIKLSFNTDRSVINPTFNGVNLFVSQDNNGNLFQDINCASINGELMTYNQVNDVITFSYNNVIQFTGRLSQDSQKLYLEFDNYVLQNNLNTSPTILNRNGEALEYEGGVKITYYRNN